MAIEEWPHPLQHRQTTLLARLQTSGAGSLADLNKRGACKSGKPTTLPTIAQDLRVSGGCGVMRKS